MSGVDDLDAIFDSLGADDFGTDVDTISANATIHAGDDLQDNLDDSVSDETETDDADDDLDIGSDDDSVEEDAEQDATSDDEFDFESVKEKLVSVSVGGQTMKVPLSELRNGYMRQADYTRKTQQLAADAEVVRWANVLRDELVNDPARAIFQMAQHFGIEFGPQDDPWQELVESDPTMEPLVARLRQQESELAELRRHQQMVAQTTAQQQEEAAVRAELNEVQSKYPDFDPRLVIPVALQNGVRLEQAYKIWKADQLTADQSKSAASQAKAEEAAARREKARKAKSRVAAGASKARASETDDWKKFDSFEELLTHQMNSR